MPENVKSLEFEKKLIDVQLTLSQLNEKVGSIDTEAISSLQQRIEDLEDLIMVEQAGILELKKMMEEQAQPTVTPGVEEKIKKLEAEIESSMQKAPPSSVEIETLREKVSDVEGKFYSVISSVESSIKNINEDVKNLKERPAPKAGVDFDLFSSKIENLKRSLDDVLKKKLEIDMKISEFDQKFEIIEDKIRESFSERILDEMKLSKRELVAINARTDSLERVIRDVISTIEKLESGVGKLESIEKVTLLGKDIDKKIQRFKFIEEEVTRLSTRIESIYDSIDKRLDKIRGVDEKFSEVKQVIDKLSKEIDSNKIQILDRAKKDDIEDIRSKLSRIERGAAKEDVMKTVESYMSDMGDMVNSVKREVDEKISGMRSFMEPQFSGDDIKSLIEKMVTLEVRIRTLENSLTQNKGMEPIILE